jgi:hypothetical protein
MGCATKGGGAVGGGPKNKMVSKPSKSTGKVLMMSEGGDVNQHKRMAMRGVRRMRKGGSCS